MPGKFFHLLDGSFHEGPAGGCRKDSEFRAVGILALGLTQDSLGLRVLGEGFRA